MILRKAILIACSVAALSAAAAVFVVALAFALYAALLPHWGPSLASAGVAGACVLLSLVVGLGALYAANPPKLTKKTPASEDMTTRMFALAREKPIVAAAAIIAAGAIALKNPKITAALVGAFLATKPPEKKK